MSTLITFACIAGLAGFVYHYTPKANGRGLFRLEQFRPAAPLAGILDTEPKEGEPGQARVE
ncbi:hypothetical protein RHDE110596_11650 [Prescottella defluvii]|uniref:hypothetical protein n=1 Tax=Prescottella defluvii TaxID=1323361 RepID=UPI0006894F1D|nr:hypothetical protein [Prescottella defluvii]